MNYKLFLIAGLILFFNAQKLRSETISFNSEDGLKVFAELYMIHPKSAPMIILFHQAGWSRGEYQEIAPKLNAKQMIYVNVQATVIQRNIELSVPMWNA